MLALNMTALASPIREITYPDWSIVIRGIPYFYQDLPANRNLGEIAKYTDGKTLFIKIQGIYNEGLSDEYDCPESVYDNLVKQQMETLKALGDIDIDCDDEYYYTKNHRHRYKSIYSFENGQYYKETIVAFMHGETYYITIRSLLPVRQEAAYNLKFDREISRIRNLVSAFNCRR